MSDVADLPQIIALLREIDVMIGKVETKAATLRVEAGYARGELRELEYVFYRVSSVMGRMGLPPQIDKAISHIQLLLLVVRMLHSALMFLEMGTPYGWVIGITTLFGAGVAWSNQAYDSSRGT